MSTTMLADPRRHFPPPPRHDLVLTPSRRQTPSYQVLEAYREFMTGKVKQRVLVNLGACPDLQTALEEARQQRRQQRRAGTVLSKDLADRIRAFQRRRHPNRGLGEPQEFPAGRNRERDFTARSAATRPTPRPPIPTPGSTARAAARRPGSAIWATY